MFSRLHSLIRSLLGRASLESEMSEEISFHIQGRTEDLIRTGLSEEEARRQARLEFGGIESYKERCRESLGLRLVDELAGDLKYTIATFARARRSP
jgi:hypothetical protein